MSPREVGDSGAAPTPRRPLGREQILREAVRLIDTEGRDRLTMRRLGSELGVEAMALYRYIPGREQLLDGVVEYVMNELYQKTMTEDLPGSWQEYLQRMAHGVRSICTDHPRVFPLVATRPPAAPWLRPPLRSLRWVEGFLASLRRFGFTDDKSVGIYRSFSTFLLGHLLLESATVDLGAEVELDDDIEFFETNDLSQYPRLMALEYQLRAGRIRGGVRGRAGGPAQPDRGRLRLGVKMTVGSASRRAKKADADPADGRDETLDERMDRNWNEMLQELRVTQTGTQIITGFLLAIAFQNRFAEMDRFQEGVYLGLVLAAVLTTAMGLAPVNLHRVLFRKHAKEVVVQIAHVLMRITLVGVGITLTGAVLLVFDVVLDRTWAVIAAAVIAVVLVAIAALPHILHDTRKADHQEKEGLRCRARRHPDPASRTTRCTSRSARRAGPRRRRRGSPTRVRTVAGPQWARRAASPARTTTGRWTSSASGPRTWVCRATPARRSPTW